MSPRMIGLSLCVLASGCAGVNRSAPMESRAMMGAPETGVLTPDGELTQAASSPRLFVGHSDTGQVVLAASHYEAMGGMAVQDTDLGLPASKNTSGKMLCDREMLTGTHVPRWVCRYQDEVDKNRAETQASLQGPRLDFGVNGAKASAGVASRGGGAGRQQ
jgi:hypothetical protein